MHWDPWGNPSIAWEHYKHAHGLLEHCLARSRLSCDFQHKVFGNADTLSGDHRRGILRDRATAQLYNLEFPEGRPLESPQHHGLGLPEHHARGRCSIITWTAGNPSMAWNHTTSIIFVAVPAVSFVRGGQTLGTGLDYYS